MPEPEQKQERYPDEHYEGADKLSVVVQWSRLSLLGFENLDEDMAQC